MFLDKESLLSKLYRIKLWHSLTSYYEGRLYLSSKTKQKKIARNLNTVVGENLLRVLTFSNSVHLN